MSPTMLMAEEPVLVPNGPKIKQLREARGWTLDDAVFHARLRNIPLSRMTLVQLEKSTGCRLQTIGWARALYGGTLDELTTERPPKVRAPRAPRRAP